MYKEAQRGFNQHRPHLTATEKEKDVNGNEVSSNAKCIMKKFYEYIVRQRTKDAKRTLEYDNDCLYLFLSRQEKLQRRAAVEYAKTLWDDMSADDKSKVPKAAPPLAQAADEQAHMQVDMTAGDLITEFLRREHSYLVEEHLSRTHTILNLILHEIEVLPDTDKKKRLARVEHVKKWILVDNDSGGIAVWWKHVKEVDLLNREMPTKMAINFGKTHAPEVVEYLMRDIPMRATDVEVFEVFKDETILDNQLRDFVTLSDAKDKDDDDEDEDSEDLDDVGYEVDDADAT